MKNNSIVDDLLEQGYAICDNFLSHEETAELRLQIAHRYEAGQFKQAGIGSAAGHQIAQQIRGDQILWIDEATDNQIERMFLEKMIELSLYLNRTCYLGIRGQEFHFAKYPIGTFYKRHLDAFQHKKGRILSVICYLNDAWQASEGGELMVYLPQQDGTEKVLKIAPLAGRMICFESDKLEHKVHPASRERISVTGWLLDK